MQNPPEDTLSFLQPLVIETHRLRTLALTFSNTYTNLALNSPSQFLATPINILPTGTETGRFLAIDVGGTNLRVGFVELLGGEGGAGKGRIRRVLERAWSIEEHLKMDNAEEFFRWIGGCIAEVVRSLNGGGSGDGDGGFEEYVIPLGITFSFPMIQSTISTATLMPMGKGFAITSPHSLDKLLLAGYHHHTTPSTSASNKKTLPEIQIAAIANDTVATLASAAYLMSSPTSITTATSTSTSTTNRQVAMAVIIATGSNATTTLPISALAASKTSAMKFPTITGDSTTKQRVVVNTEWGISGTAPPLHTLSLVTPWDALLDRETAAPGFQPFEYMTSGRYLGELVRIVLVDYLVNTTNTPSTNLPPLLLRKNSLTTLFLSSAVAQTSSAPALLQKLSSLFPPLDTSPWHWTPHATQALLSIERHVLARSARLNAAAVVGLLICAGEILLNPPCPQQLPTQLKKITVAYAGGVICQYPGYLAACQGAVTEIVEALEGPGCRYTVSLREAADGGLIGAAVLAGTVWRV